MKVNSKVYKGIEYIQINDLPESQQVLISKTIDPEMIIKILIDKKIINNCIQYKDYEAWLENFYGEELSRKEQTTAPIKEAGVVFDHA